MHYRHKVHEPGTRARILDLALNGSGNRDTARVLRISPQTVLSELKKSRGRRPAAPCVPDLCARPGGSVTAQVERI